MASYLTKRRDLCLCSPSVWANPALARFEHRRAWRPFTWRKAFEIMRTCKQTLQTSRRGGAMVFQIVSLYPSHEVEENNEFRATHDGRSPEKIKSTSQGKTLRYLQLNRTLDRNFQTTLSVSSGQLSPLGRLSSPEFFLVDKASVLYLDCPNARRTMPFNRSTSQQLKATMVTWLTTSWMPRHAPIKSVNAPGNAKQLVRALWALSSIHPMNCLRFYWLTKMNFPMGKNLLAIDKADLRW